MDSSSICIGLLSLIITSKEHLDRLSIHALPVEVTGFMQETPFAVLSDNLMAVGEVVVDDEPTTFGFESADCLHDGHARYFRHHFILSMVASKCRLQRGITIPFPT
jgi:hypothetical protein